MRKSTIWTSEYFCGNKISEYGLENGRVDYRTLAKAFDAVLNNNIMSVTGWENWEQENGLVDNSEEIEELREELEGICDRLNYGDDVTDDEREELESKQSELEDEIAELEDEQDYPPEIYQYFIVDGRGAEILEDYTDDPVFYNDELDMYVWGVTHWGTSWDYVLTDIKVELNK